MKLENLQKAWESLAKFNPTWAILTTQSDLNQPQELERFFASGKEEVAQMLQRVSELEMPFSRNQAMDFGCGMGRLSQALALTFDRVVGIDVSPTMIELAEQNNRFPTRCEYVLNEEDSLSFLADGSVSFIYSNIVLQHIPSVHIRAYLAEFARVLAVGGVAVFQVPSARATALSRRVATFALPKVYPLIPAPLLKFYRRRRYRSAEADAIPRFTGPALRLHGIDRQQVLQIMEPFGIKPVAIDPTLDVGEGWPSYRYYMRKLE